MIQYLFDGEEHLITPAPHRNSTKPQAQSYIRTKSSTLGRVREVAETAGPKEAFHKVNEENGGLLNAGSAGDLPRNCDQARYYRSTTTSGKQSSKTIDSLAIIIEECKRQQMSIGEEPFIRDVTGAPEFRCVLGFDWQLKEIVQFCTNPNHFSIYTADPTFNLGSFNLTVTTYRHLKVVTRRDGHHPIMIGPLLISQLKTEETYNYFFGKVAALNKDIRNILAIGTDGEEPLINGMKNVMSHATHLRCFGHFRDNCKSKLRESHIPEKFQQSFLHDLLGKQEGTTYEKGKIAPV